MRFAPSLIASCVLVVTAILAVGDNALAISPSAKVSAEERTAIVQECADLSTAYSYYLDSADYERMPSVFAKDGVWEVLGNHLVGSQAIRNYWQQRTSLWKAGDRWRHVITNQKIDVVDHDNAVGRAYFTVYKFNADAAQNKALVPLVLTQSVDEYVRTSEGWRIKLRRIELVGATAP